MGKISLVGRDHGDLGPLNGAAADAHRPFEIVSNAIGSSLGITHIPGFIWGGGIAVTTSALVLTGLGSQRWTRSHSRSSAQD